MFDRAPTFHVGAYICGLRIPAANLPPVSTTLANLVAKFSDGFADTGGKFAASVVDTGGAPLLTNISTFEKI